VCTTVDVVPVTAEGCITGVKVVGVFTTEGVVVKFEDEAMCDVFFVHVGDFAVVTFTVLLPCPQPAALCTTLPMRADLHRFHN
jgi:hypothetical protein